MPPPVHICHPLTRRSSVEDLKAALALHGVTATAGAASPAVLEKAGLFLICCAGGVYSEDEVAAAIEHLRKRPRPHAWLVVLQLTRHAIPQTLTHLPLISLHEEWQRGIAQIVSLTSPEVAPPAAAPPRRARTVVNGRNIVGEDLSFIHDRGADGDMDIRAKGDIVANRTALFRNGSTPTKRGAK